MRASRRAECGFATGAKATGGALLFAAIVMVAACGGPDKHRYTPPSGMGEIRWDPERGIYRDGDRLNLPEEELYRRAVVAMQDGEFNEAAKAFHELRTAEQYVDGTRALDAIISESICLLEAGRAAKTKWLLGDLANAVLDRDDDAAASRLPDDVRNKLSEEAIAGYARSLSSSAIDASFDVAKDVFEYYSTGLGVTPKRLADICKHERNLAYFAFLSGEDALAGRIAKDLADRNPRGLIQSQALLILAKSEDRRELFEASREHYARVYGEGQSLSDDPDTQEEALLGELRAIIHQSKGPGYDIGLWEAAAEKVTDYKTSFLVAHPDARLRANFAEHEQYINMVRTGQFDEAAKCYGRLFEKEAVVIYRARAAEFRAGADKQEKNWPRSVRGGRGQ
jgi:hypothetical protein